MFYCTAYSLILTCSAPSFTVEVDETDKILFPNWLLLDWLDLLLSSGGTSEGEPLLAWSAAALTEPLKTWGRLWPNAGSLAATSACLSEMINFITGRFFFFAGALVAAACFSESL